MQFKIELSILSNAPQLVDTKLKVGKKLLKDSKNCITKKDVRRCFKQLFPIGSVVRIRQVSISEEHYRQVITATVSSLRQPSTELEIIGMPKDFYVTKVTKLNG